jgi:hypothetical protein
LGIKDTQVVADWRIMRHRLLFVALLACMVAPTAGGSSPRRCCPQDWVQLATGPAASYALDHGGYVGMSPDALRAYDGRLRYVAVVSADASTYCLESAIGSRTAFKNGPEARVLLGSCAQPDEGTAVAVHSPDDSLMRVRAAIPAMEAYDADHDGYAGATVKKLRKYDYGIRAIKIVRATKRTYCIESTVGPWSGFKNGPAAPVRAGLCRRR